MNKKSISSGGLIILSTFFVIVAIATIIGVIIGAIRSPETEAKTLPVDTEITKEYNKISEKVFYFETDTQESLNEMYDFLETRNGAIVTEVSNGTVIHAETGYGILDNGGKIRYSDKYIYYPKYTYDYGYDFRNGDRFKSVFIYNPENNSTDDIICRVDIPLFDIRCMTGVVKDSETVITEDGERWIYDTEYPNETPVLVYIHDNGTKNIKDDIILDVYTNAYDDAIQDPYYEEWMDDTIE